MFTAIMQVIGATLFAGYVAYKTVKVGNAFKAEPEKAELTWTEYCAWQQMRRA